jgi:hypothetical protein
MTVEDVLTEAMVLYLQQGPGHELEYVSKSESSSLGWYFWLRGLDGVYEIERKDDLQPGGGEFYVRYYPGKEEMVLEEYSVEEQLLRFDESVFDDMLIHRPTEEHEVCPCCAAGHVHHEDHEHCGGEHHEHQEAGTVRPKGIPRLLKKFTMNKELYSIGDLSVNVRPDGAVSAEIRTRDRLVEYAKASIRINQNGTEVEVIRQGDVNRNVPGYELSRQFMEFFGNRFLSGIRKHGQRQPAERSGRLESVDLGKEGVLIRYTN